MSIESAPNIFPASSFGFVNRHMQMLWIAGAAPPPNADRTVDSTKACGDVVVAMKKYPKASMKREIRARAMSNCMSFKMIVCAWDKEEIEEAAGDLGTRIGEVGTRIGPVSTWKAGVRLPGGGGGGSCLGLKILTSTSDR